MWGARPEADDAEAVQAPHRREVPHVDRVARKRPPVLAARDAAARAFEGDEADAVPGGAARDTVKDGVHIAGDGEAAVLLI